MSTIGNRHQGAGIFIFSFFIQQMAIQKKMGRKTKATDLNGQLACQNCKPMKSALSGSSLKEIKYKPYFLRDEGPWNG